MRSGNGGWHVFRTLRRMAASAHSDLSAYMDAYRLLGVDYSAHSTDIRRAYRRLARQHHPDRFPLGSDEQQRASARMAEINAAYALAEHAPLRYHRVSRAADPDTPWTDAELKEAIRRAALNRRFDAAMSIALVLLAIIAIRLLLPALSAQPSSAQVLVVGVGLLSAVTMWSLLGPRMWHLLFQIQLVLAIVRVLRNHWSSFF